jgi:hypothetical protein
VVAEKEVAARSFTLNRSLQFLAAVAAAVPPAPPLPAAAIDEILLVHGWLQRHAEAVHVLDLAGLVAPDTEGAGSRDAHHAALTGLAEELVARVRLCGAPAQDVDEDEEATAGPAPVGDAAAERSGDADGTASLTAREGRERRYAEGGAA